MKKAVLISSLLCVLALSSCDLLDDSPCGVKETFDVYLLGSSIVDTTTGIYYSYMQGNDRVFQWSQIVENVCAEEHVKTDFRVALVDENPNGIIARGRVSWQFFFEDEWALNKSGTDLKGGGETGLKQAFGEDPGWYVPALEVVFQTFGTYAADTAFLKQNVISVEIMSKYRKH